MKKSFGVIDVDSKCENCEWGTQSYKNGQAISAKHAKKYGHCVRGEVHYGFVYDATDEVQDKK